MSKIFIHTGNIKEINENDIELFYSINNKSRNDSCNKQREYILLSIVNKQIPELWLLNEKWKNLYNKLWKFVFEISNTNEKSNILKIYKGSRLNNYDFLLIDIQNQQEYKIEFKYNIDKIIKSPEFLSISCKDILINNIDYSEFFYDNYISKIANLYNIQNLIPSKEKYLKNIFSINYKNDKFFDYLYKNEKLFIKEKKKITDESISNFLNQDIPINFNKVLEKLKNQENKIYLCYKNENFYFDKINKEELENLEFQNIINNNVIILKNKNSKSYLKLLLRWKNHSGILYPAYQISLIRN